MAKFAKSNHCLKRAFIVRLDAPPIVMSSDWQLSYVSCNAAAKTVVDFVDISNHKNEIPLRNFDISQFVKPALEESYFLSTDVYTQSWFGDAYLVNWDIQPGLLQTSADGRVWRFPKFAAAAVRHADRANWFCVTSSVEKLVCFTRFLSHLSFLRFLWCATGKLNAWVRWCKSGKSKMSPPIYCRCSTTTIINSFKIGTLSDATDK